MVTIMTKNKPRSSKISHSCLEGESATLYLDGTLSTQIEIADFSAKDQISWINWLWSKALAEPRTMDPSAPVAILSNNTSEHGSRKCTFIVSEKYNFSAT